jgi:hypothetical protein
LNPGITWQSIATKPSFSAAKRLPGIPLDVAIAIDIDPHSVAIDIRTRSVASTVDLHIFAISIGVDASAAAFSGRCRR